LPTPGGPTKQRIGPFIFGRELADGEVLEDPLLDLLEVVVVLVEDLPRAGQVVVVGRGSRPRAARSSSRGTSG
jgi:hypothetical protein